MAKIISEKAGFKTIWVSREELLEKLGPLGSKSSDLLNMVNASIQVVIRNLGLLQEQIMNEQNKYSPGAAK